MRLSFPWLKLAFCITAFSLCACSTTPAYPPIPAGHHRVQAGDTLYRIARNSGRSVSELRSWNNLSGNAINVGQVLRIIPPPRYAAKRPNVSPRPSQPATKPARPAAKPKPAPASGSIALSWPAKGQLIQGYSSRNKGIDIAGKPGDAILAAGAGKVVYAGQGIRAYGKLLIIKHNEAFLSAYAHNQSLKVKEGDTVRRGQPIASMGSSGTDRTKLHFELRYRGQAVDPMPYLK
ncbi:peptidoglycan DD-metalloendopeptidase family protein [Craterilacuibacter sp. RT1T]|uniref:peptidoglycan DD-metalloendopeptidase family protein n=1 Tax=Craterilacuibacter sp. RT1T TaxID=2942211 RepID=UPI0020C17903|nr:peptidoglycan DD-metalloendopeptidase family protein [Craterilacuibacter sp. RT1T]MCL6264237.1 peptidoglycan DD-metalloendopeptidase family protein [Craterilacuibacter sp. RT1T]